MRREIRKGKKISIRPERFIAMETVEKFCKKNGLKFSHLCLEGAYLIATGRVPIPAEALPTKK